MTNQMKHLQAEIPETLHTWLRMEAVRRGTTIKQLVLDMIANEMIRTTIDDANKPSGNGN